MATVTYQLQLPGPPEPIDNQNQLGGYTNTLQSDWNALITTLQDFALEVGIAINFELVDRSGSTIIGLIDFTNGALILPVFPGDPVPTPPTGEIYYETSTNRVRVQLATGPDSFAMFQDVYLRQVPGGENTTVVSGAVGTVVTFSTPQANASYGVNVTPAWNTTVWVTAKIAACFQINYGTAAPSGGSKIDMIIWR